MFDTPARVTAQAERREGGSKVASTPSTVTSQTRVAGSTDLRSYEPEDLCTKLEDVLDLLEVDFDEVNWRGAAVDGSGPTGHLPWLGLRFDDQGVRSPPPERTQRRSRNSHQPKGVIKSSR